MRDMFAEITKVEQDMVAKRKYVSYDHVSLICNYFCFLWQFGQEEKEKVAGAARQSQESCRERRSRDSRHRRSSREARIIIIKIYRVRYLT